MVTKNKVIFFLNQVQTTLGSESKGMFFLSVLVVADWLFQNGDCNCSLFSIVKQNYFILSKFYSILREIGSIHAGKFFNSNYLFNLHVEQIFGVTNNLTASRIEISCLWFERWKRPVYKINSSFLTEYVGPVRI